ncbi:HAMP domain-containing sensor histidine kinase [uncultured Microbulbifer sp.]|uniref:sensor histidine kinase n=1 Tax=uncultured Microbulbifer sp. TaxID=348147 RepID=UPI00262027FC|nr:HAMP domain-containing sensor histidine kinase [uncultured Microbulbifer sp.]
MTAYVVEDQLIDNLIDDEIAYLEQYFKRYGELPPPRLPQFTLHTSPENTPKAFTSALAGDRRKAEYFASGNPHYHLRKLSPESGAILSAEVGDLITVTRQSERLIWMVLFAFVCTTAIALWLAHRLITATIRPVLSLAQEVEAQATGVPALALSTSTRNDEIGFLARTLERNVRELQHAREREAEFTRDVSHELRTNLAVVSNALTLSGDRGLGAAETRELRGILANMNRTVSTLLALARSESFELEAFDLRALLEDRLLARPEISMKDDFDLHLALPDKLSAFGNPSLTGILLDILLDNAMQHASQPRLSIYQVDDTLVLENAVRTTLPTEALFDAGTRGENSTGIGQGLYLAGRILAAQHWSHTVRCADHTFSIRITTAPADSQ